MTGRERVACAMRRKAADRVPVFCQLALGHYFLNACLPAHRIWFTSEGFAEALVKMQRRYRFDGLLINLPGRPPNLLEQLRRVEKTPDGERLYWKKGETSFVPEDDNPRHYSAGGGPTRRADFATIDPDKLGGLEILSGYWWNTIHAPRLDDAPPGLMTRLPDYFLNTIKLVQAATAGEVSINGEVFSPFTHFMELLGYENALMALIDDPGKVHALMERMTETSVSWATAQARAGVDAVLISSAFAGGGFLSREMYSEFVLPYERKLAGAVHTTQPGLPVYTHTCGNIGDRLDLMVKTNIDGLDTLDPPPLGNSLLEEAKREVGRKVFLKGNMNSVELLLAKSAEQVVAEATRCLAAARDGGGYILSTACSVAPRVEPWKLEMLVPLAEQEGSYATTLSPWKLTE
jgi:uroporphyrinogen-III decarboxylase